MSTAAAMTQDAETEDLRRRARLKGLGNLSEGERWRLRNAEAEEQSRNPPTDLQRERERRAQASQPEQAPVAGMMGGSITKADLPSSMQPWCDAAASVGLVFQMSSLSATEVAEETKEKIDALRSEIVTRLESAISALVVKSAEQQARIAELEAKCAITAHSVERMTVDRTGPRGERGAQGDRGAEGPRGIPGESVKGPRGQPGDRIVNWRLSPEEMLAFPINENGKELPALNLQPFFDHFATESGEYETWSAEELEIERLREKTARHARDEELARHGITRMPR